jgi:hypothetical protein
VNTRDFYDDICSIVREETKWLKHYSAKVLDVNDNLKMGRVQCAIYEFNWTDKQMGIWAWPREKHAMSVPVVGSWIELYFMNGDPARAVYMGLSWESYSGKPPVKNYDGPTKRVIFEDPNSKTKNIKYDGSLLTINDGTESFVLGNTFKTYLDQKKIWDDAHTHSGSGSGPPSSPSPTIPTILSTEIKGK